MLKGKDSSSTTQASPTCVHIQETGAILRPLLARENFPKPLSTSVSFRHPMIQLSCYFHSHDAHKKGKRLGAHIPSRGPSVTCI